MHGFNYGLCLSPFFKGGGRAWFFIVLSPGVEKSRKQIPVFLVFFFFWISWILWAHAWLWASILKKTDSEFLCGNGAMTSEREYIFPQLSTRVPEVKKSRTVVTILFYFQFHDLCELMCEYQHLLEQSKIDLDFLWGDGIMASGGECIFPQRSPPKFQK